jgi:serine/threonine protein kinase
VLGRGGFGTVYEAECLGKKVAAKKLQLSAGQPNAKERLEAFRKEV